MTDDLVYRCNCGKCDNTWFTPDGEPVSSTRARWIQIVGWLRRVWDSPWQGVIALAVLIALGVVLPRACNILL